MKRWEMGIPSIIGNFTNESDEVLTDIVRRELADRRLEKMHEAERPANVAIPKGMLAICCRILKRKSFLPDKKNFEDFTPVEKGLKKKSLVFAAFAISFKAFFQSSQAERKKKNSRFFADVYGVMMVPKEIELEKESGFELRLQVPDARLAMRIQVLDLEMEGGLRGKWRNKGRTRRLKRRWSL
ncbi:hypothetical protein ACLOJK_041712 [Asimina triloba]